MSSEHIVTAYDEELTHLNEMVVRMGGLAEAALAGAIQAIVKRDSVLAARIIEGDAVVDDLEHQINEDAIRLLALRQPMATDLREIIAALKISSDLERIADYATNVAKRTLALVDLPPVKPVHVVPRMSKLAQSMITDVLDAYIERDADKAVRVWERDEELDEIYTSLLRELLTYMMEDPRSIGACSHLLFIAKNIERVGDHATNVAENIYYLVHGSPLLRRRPKGETDDIVPILKAPAARRKTPKGAAKGRAKRRSR